MNIVLISMIGLIRTDYISDAISFSIVPILISTAIILFSKDFVLFSDRKSIKWDVILAGLFIVMLSAEEVLKTMRSMDHEMLNTIFKVIYFPLLFAALVIDVDYAQFFTLSRSKGSDTSSDDAPDTANNGRFLGIHYPVWILIAITYMFVIAYYPGLMNSDFEAEWMWGWSDKTNWSDWHTVGYLFFVRLCTAIIHKPVMITIAQVLMYYLTINYAVSVLKRRFPSFSRVGFLFIGLYIGFSLYSCVYMSEIRKDNCSSPMLLAFAISVLDYVLSKNHERRQYINLTVFAFLAAIFRHSLPEVVAVTLICVIIGEFRNKSLEQSERKKNILRLCAVIVVYIASYLILTEGIAFGLLRAERNPAYIKYTIPMNLAASMAYRSQETGLYIDDDIVKKMEQIIPMEKWAEYYCPYDADTTDRPWHEIGDNVLKLNDPKIAKDIIAVNWYYLTHYPKQCILSFFDVNSMVWEIAKASDLIMYSPGLATEHYEIHHMRKGEFFWVSENIKSFLGSTAVGRTVVYRGGLYLYLMAVIILILFRKRFFRVFTAMLPVLLYAAALMISIPQEGTHYIMVFAMFAALFGAVVLSLPAKNDIGQNPTV